MIVDYVTSHINLILVSVLLFGAYCGEHKAYNMKQLIFSIVNVHSFFLF